MVNPISHIDVTVCDLKAAKKFYSELFGWRFIAYSENYELFIAGEGVKGGFRLDPQAAPDSAAVRFSIEVDDIPATLEKVTHAGGTVIQQERDIPHYGKYAIFRDPVGTVVGLRTTPPG